MKSLSVLLTLKDGKEEIWAYESDFNGKPYFNIRKVYLTADNAYGPTKDGITVALERKDELCGMLCLLSVKKEG